MVVAANAPAVPMEIGGVLKIKWSRYIPPERRPMPKQAAFLSLMHREALFGGAAGGGKTEALCMDALRWFDQPGFSCILFRRKLTDHKLKNSCLNRIMSWLEPWLANGDVKYYPGEHTLRSKEGGTITFGYLDKADSKERYQSSEYNLIIFDELTHFKEDEYLFLFTRMRRTTDNLTIPARMRGGTNPGSRGHGWVKKRFQIEKDADGEFRGKDKKRPFIQAKARDNVKIDAKGYELNLMEVDPITRERMLNGDWSVSETAVFKPEAFQYRWRVDGDYYILENGQNTRTYHVNSLMYFTTVDSACSEIDGIENRSFRPNYEPSWSCCGYFGLTQDYELLWLDLLRGQWSVPIFVTKMLEKNKIWRSAFARVESNHVGKAVCQFLHAKGLTIFPTHSSTDKLARSFYAQVRSGDYGKIWLPDPSTEAQVWVPDLEDELFVWTGKKGEVADQVDVLSSAAEYAALRAHGRERELGASVTGGKMPMAVGGLQTASGEAKSSIRSVRGGLSAGRRRKTLFQPFKR